MCLNERLLVRNIKIRLRMGITISVTDELSFNLIWLAKEDIPEILKEEIDLMLVNL